jgi:hypothetical protein
MRGEDVGDCAGLKLGIGLGIRFYRFVMPKAFSALTIILHPRYEVI